MNIVKIFYHIYNNKNIYNSNLILTYWNFKDLHTVDIEKELIPNILKLI